MVPRTTTSTTINQNESTSDDVTTTTITTITTPHQQHPMTLSTTTGRRMMTPIGLDEEAGEWNNENDDENNNNHHNHHHDTNNNNNNNSSSNKNTNHPIVGMVPLLEVSIEHLSYAPFIRTTTTTTTTTTPTTTTTTSNDTKRFLFHRLPRTTTTTMQQRKMILSNITTTIEPYQLTAWMGPSGSGKTSLMSVVAGLISSSTSDILPNSIMKVNHEIGTIPKRYIGVVWQDDLLLSNLTVEENLYMAARLKTSDTIHNDTVRKIVIETMIELNLIHVRHSLVGDPLHTISSSSSTPERGISGGERKRVAVGMELVVRPSILLLDEITSGLDSTTALNLIRTLQQLAHTKGHTIVVVIHQPRTTIFNLFDHLLLLSRGYVIYNGPPNMVRSYFETHYGPLPPETGIADWMMDIVTTMEKKHDHETKQCSSSSTTTGSSGNNNELVQHWINYSNETNTTTVSSQMNNSHRVVPYQQKRMSSLQELRTGPKFNTSFMTQLRILIYRVMKQQRGERITRSATMLQILYMFFTSLFWWRIPDNTGRIYERNSLLFFILIAQANSIVITAVTVFQRERVLLSRERAKKMYQVSSYFIAKTLSDVTNNVLLPLLYSMVVYWTAGFRATFVAYIKYVVVFYWIFSTAQSMGLFISITIPNRTTSLLFAPPITLFFAILGGFYIPLDNLHPGVQWATYLSFARYGYSALIINEYQGRTVPCSDDVSIGIPITECPLPGEAVLSSFGIHGINQNYWFNVGMMIILQIIFRVGAYAVLRRSK